MLTCAPWSSASLGLTCTRDCPDASRTARSSSASSPSRAPPSPFSASYSLRASVVLAQHTRAVRRLGSTFQPLDLPSLQPWPLRLRALLAGSPRAHRIHAPLLSFSRAQSSPSSPSASRRRSRGGSPSIGPPSWPSCPKRRSTNTPESSTRLASSASYGTAGQSIPPSSNPCPPPRTATASGCSVCVFAYRTRQQQRANMQGLAHAVPFARSPPDSQPCLSGMPSPCRCCYGSTLTRGEGRRGAVLPKPGFKLWMRLRVWTKSNNPSLRIRPPCPPSLAS